MKKWGLFALNLCFFFLTFHFHPSIAEAQPLMRGMAIRVHLENQIPTVGWLQDVSSDSLWFQQKKSRVKMALPIESITRIDIRQESHLKGALLGAGIGFAIGASVGTITCMADPESCKSRTDESDLEASIASGMFLGFGVGLLGALAGRFLLSSYWKRISPPYTTLDQTSAIGRPAFQIQIRL